MDIEEIKKKKSELEGQILGMLKEFEKETGMLVSYINSRSDYGYDMPVTSTAEVKKEKSRKRKGVLDVTIDINFDNDPSSID